MGYVVPLPPDAEVDAVSPLVSFLVTLGGLVVIVALIFGLASWATAGRAGTVVTYVCEPGDTAVIRDGFGQRTPQCVTADGATVYWPDRVRVPR